MNFTKAYSTSGCTAIARLAGSVHGVVVQIRKLTLAFKRRSNFPFTAPGLATANST
jgi:hypothetical protein